ncbi:hypothetical protein QTP88_008829 [Uroleucon formosanum]
MNSMVNNEDDSMNSMDVICNPMANDEVCMKMPAAQQLNVPSTESIANKIQQLYNMFVSQAGTLDEQQLQTINLTVDSSLKVLYQQESKCMNDVEYREPANKNIDKQLRFYSTKKPRTKAPEEQRLNRPTIKVIKQIKSDLKGIFYFITVLNVRVPRKASISTLWLNFGQKEHCFIQSQFNKSNFVCSLHFEKHLFNVYNKSVRLKENPVPSIIVHRVKHVHSFEESMIVPKESTKINLDSNHKIINKTMDKDLSSSHIEGINELPNSNECTQVKNEESIFKKAF